MSQVSSYKKIHINLPEDVHKKLRIKCALEDSTMQDFVLGILQQAIDDVQLPEGKERTQERK